MQATASHEFFHQNTHTLQKQFQLTPTEAHDIVESCDDFHALAVPLPAEALGPRRFGTDVTQIAEFGQLKYVHVTVDTFYSAMWASTHTGEKTLNVIAHRRQAFAVLGIPSAMKTDSGPAYALQKASDETHQPQAKVQILGYTGHLQSVFVLTCDRKGKIQPIGKLETLTKMKVIK
ncbi:hypothetical protein DUI87_21560 [Hirundo rustica rustica]|uniref:RNA-directed DNA polymerase n=1 Tax=Hirundo rustica rustica TaxID=333673 RepID=A0A3M0JUG9_HIRRU|nr:hypothetical protein DUI87_21560 [Hirundo rustica rustica]